MIRETTPPNGDAAVDKAVSLFMALVRDGQTQPLSALAKERGIAPSTAYRLIQPFLKSGLLTKPRRQCYMPGLTLFDLARQWDQNTVLAEAARPVLKALAKQTKDTVHLGVWADDMVTYLVKAGGAKAGVFTQEGMQLEAYCSGIGKVLLSHMDEDAQDAYLANGPFIALTEKTVTDPEAMRQEWQRVKAQGYGQDSEEISEGLHCISVPLRGPNKTVIAAISISSQDQAMTMSGRIPQLLKAARSIQDRLVS